jgi:hypothetical protein
VELGLVYHLRIPARVVMMASDPNHQYLVFPPHMLIEEQEDVLMRINNTLQLCSTARRLLNRWQHPATASIISHFFTAKQ